MKGLKPPKFRIPMALFATFAVGGCPPPCNCNSGMDCSGDIDNVVYVCELENPGCEPDKGYEGFCTEAFPEEDPGGSQTTPQ